MTGLTAGFVRSSGVFTPVSGLGLTTCLRLPDVAALRFGIGGTLLLPVLVRRGLAGVSWRRAAALACFGGVEFAPLAYAGFSLAPAAHGAVLLHGMLPLFTHALTRGGAGRALAPAHRRHRAHRGGRRAHGARQPRRSQ